MIVVGRCKQIGTDLAVEEGWCNCLPTSVGDTSQRVVFLFNISHTEHMSKSVNTIGLSRSGLETFCMTTDVNLWKKECKASR